VFGHRFVRAGLHPRLGKQQSTLMPLLRRLLPLLQLTRIALVFTAISNSLAAMLLLAKWGDPARNSPSWSPWFVLTPWNVIALVAMSAGMYGFGMSLNDIIDRRRDSQIAPGRPLPSGRIGVASAHLICVAMAILAMAGAVAYAWGTGRWPGSVIVAAVTLVLICFYDFAGKYLVAAGLISLGLIRFFHAAVAAPQVPLLWHPLLLLNHVTLLSTVCYALEDKRPRLSRGHWLAVIAGLLLINAMSVAVVWYRRHRVFEGFAQTMWITPALWLAGAAVAGFIVAAIFVFRATENRRAAGQTIMLLGLLWLIVYDAAIVAGHVDYRAAWLILLLLPVAYCAVIAMRWWGRIIALSQPVEYQRAR
jgi:4-hydroxybenzoate polyprenyltransferase